MKKILVFFYFPALLFLIFSCGEGVVEVTSESYEPKLAIEGFLIANQKVDKIRISRNFPLDANLSRTNLIPDVNKTSVTITDVAEDKTYNLTFHVTLDNLFENYYWQYNNSDLIIQPGKTYRLDVAAQIDGKFLNASSTTVVPNSGFSIAHYNYNRLTFREKDTYGNLKQFEFTFNRTPGVSFYFASARAINPSEDNFIFENPFFAEDPDDFHFKDYDYQYGWIQDTPLDAGQTTFTLFWANLWFYDRYELILYATDDNYREFIQTYNDVQEQDGNFHEAKFNIDGDGIGVFGSMIADTVYIEVLRN